MFTIKYEEKNVLITLLKWPVIKLLDQFDLYALLVLRNGTLKDDGWFNSFKLKVPVDCNNNPLPWMPYSFIDFIRDRLNNNMNILEFGSGNSTLFLSAKVKYVTAVEHDFDWFNTIKNKIPENVTINYISLNDGDNYIKFATNQNCTYNIIIVDGRHRVNCIINSIDALAEDGIIILDDSEVEKYSEGKQFLINIGFKKIDFWGISPGQTYKKCTSVFYRQINCLGL